MSPLRAKREEVVAKLDEAEKQYKDIIRQRAENRIRLAEAWGVLTKTVYRPTDVEVENVRLAAALNGFVELFDLGRQMLEVEKRVKANLGTLNTDLHVLNKAITLVEPEDKKE